MENTEIVAGDHSVQIKIYTDDREGNTQSKQQALYRACWKNIKPP